MVTAPTVRVVCPVLFTALTTGPNLGFRHFVLLAGRGRLDVASRLSSRNLHFENEFARIVHPLRQLQDFSGEIRNVPMKRKVKFTGLGKL